MDLVLDTNREENKETSNPESVRSLRKRLQYVCDLAAGELQRYRKLERPTMT